MWSLFFVSIPGAKAGGWVGGVGWEHADPVLRVHRHPHDLDSELRVVAGDERILEEANCSRNASRNRCSEGWHGGSGHLENPEVDEVPFGEIGSKPASAYFIFTLLSPRHRWDELRVPACQHRASRSRAGQQQLQSGEEVRSCKVFVIFVRRKHRWELIDENLHVGGVMLGKQVNGCGHWWFEAGCGKRGHKLV